ncbi:ElyC/SanA/YdcF family protein [Vreelandella profundi]|uniref:ElyC/SanA/YdcF family protein n=1 Tax=Vreelandella profundi TaxID=2852117 RepID=UPI001F39CE61|nr:ElyC/SanA/YdcF family protein [Halomonas profundi]
MAGLGLAVLFLASWAPVAERLLTPFETRYPALLHVPQRMPFVAVVVLGGGWQPDAPVSSVSKLSESSAIRLMEGIRLWRQVAELPLIVSGASRNAAIAPVAQGYAQAAQSLGVPEAQLQVLDWPTDTGQEAQAVSQLLGKGASIILVTSASHMPRAMRHFQAAGLSPIAAPTHYLTQFNSPNSVRYWVPSASHLHKTERAVYEALGNLMVNIEH